MKKNYSIDFIPLTKRIAFLLISGLAASFSCHKDTSAEITEDDFRQSNYLPDSGQTTSYTSTSGEDADFLFHAPSFTDNGNETVTDNVTGLSWQKTDGGEMTFESARSYCEALVLGDHNDWRLPDSHELFSINNFDKVNPALDVTYFTKTTAEYWWTSDVRADLSSNIWVVNAGGGIGAHPKTETISAGGNKRFHVRAVRKNTAITLPALHFTDNGDGTISDNYTGLLWQKIPNSSTLTWEEALIYAKGLSLAGKSGWRLPNIRELQSLNDEKLFKPSFNKYFFPNVLSGNFWSSTSQVNSPTRAWDLNVDYGIVSYNEKTIRENVLCVRGGEN
jgi:hypothetical protein